MKAIVLTCDRYRALAEHMIFQYGRLWPDHAFRFRVACQTLPTAGSNERVEYRLCPEAIKATVLTLIEDLPEDEWVYWCIDDKYPVALDLPRVRQTAKWVTGLRAPEISGVSFCRCRHLWQEEYLTGGRIADDAGNVYCERKDYEQIWLHQFLRVKALRHLFGNFPDEIPHAKLMDELKKGVTKPPEQRLYVARENLAILGESTTAGELTANCAESFHRSGLALPEGFSSAGEHKIMGRFTFLQRLRLWGKG